MKYFIKFWKSKNKLQQALLIGGFLILLSVCLAAVYTYYLIDKTKDMVSDSFEEIDRSENKSPLRKDNVDPVSHNVSILFIGVDTGEERDYGESSRSDALLFATFNSKDNTIKLLSIPRDTYTYIPDLGYNTKINHAHFFGGAKATINTVEDFLNVPVDYYVRLNFDAFIEVVDALNGINFEVPYEMYEMDSHDKVDAIHLLPGEQVLTGEEALAIARTRKYDNDVERGLRQQEIIKAIFEKATSVSSLFKLGSVLDAIGTNMSTNLSFSQMTSFISYVTDEAVDIESIQLEGSGGYMEDGGWYYQVDEESKQQISQALREHLNISWDSNYTNRYSNMDNYSPLY
ncbi:LCP family protein [Paucisalibacillus globulus]|uniref:LCP family protein n=1 Tax=Paucisalibacillus globulus TaxID=351095 RepID=UPI0003F8C938|nr:LCP family protein [Paucisalibacillus globulus]